MFIPMHDLIIMLIFGTIGVTICSISLLDHIAYWIEAIRFAKKRDFDNWRGYKPYKPWR